MHKNLSVNPILHFDKLLNEVKCNVSDFESVLQLFENPHTLLDFSLLVQFIFLVPELVLHIWLYYCYIQTLIYMKENVYFSFDQPGHNQLLILPMFQIHKKRVQKLSTSIVLESNTTSKTKSTILQAISSARENRRRLGWVSSVSLASSAW